MVIKLIYSVKWYYPKKGEKKIQSEDVLHHGQKIIDKLKDRFGLEGIKLAGAIKKVIVRKAEAPLKERVFLPPVVTPEGVIVGLGEKATYAATLALQITRLALKLSPGMLPDSWVQEINKLLPSNGSFYTGDQLPDAFIRDKDVEVDESDIITEILSALRSFTLTEVGIAIYKSYEEEQEKFLSLLQRSHSVNEQNTHVDPSVMCLAPKIQRASSDPYQSKYSDHVPTRIELMTPVFKPSVGGSPFVFWKMMVPSSDSIT
jgi:hypothetical protein